MSDGLLTNLSLILGFAGAHPAASVVRLAGLAGLVAGAGSMASGEWISVRSQAELLEFELGVERRALASNPSEELAELTELYVGKGLPAPLAAELSAAIMANPELALETHAREELGIDPRSLGSPVQAAVASFFAFSVGALLPLAPWLVTGGTVAVVASSVAGLVGAASLGATVARFSGRPLWRGVLRQVLLTTGAAAATTGFGWLVGAG